MKHIPTLVFLAAGLIGTPTLSMAQTDPHTCGMEVELVDWMFGRDIYDVSQNDIPIGFGFSLDPDKDRVRAFIASEAQQIGMVLSWRASKEAERVPLTHKVLREDGSEVRSSGSRPYLALEQLIYDVSPGKYCVLIPGVDGAQTILGSFRPS